MERIYAPWRSKYTQKDKHSNHSSLNNTTCIFCEQIAANDDDLYFILKRYTHHIIMLNKYPYNAGHLLIIPYKHLAALNDQAQQERTELIELMNYSCEVLKTAIHAEGINLGLNLGKVSGGSIPNYIHTHVLPRWLGDTNFLPALAETKQVSISLQELFDKLKPHF